MIWTSFSGERCGPWASCWKIISVRILIWSDCFLAPGVSQPGFPQATYTAPQASNPNASLYPVVNFGPENTTGQTQYQPPSYSTLYQTPPQHYPTPSEVPEKQPSAPPPPSYDEVKHYFGHLGLWSRENLNFPSFESHTVSWFLFL